MTAPELTASESAQAQAAVAGTDRRPTRPWFRKKRFILPLALTVSILIIQASDIGFGGPFTDDTTVSQPKVAAALAPGIGTVGRDGKTLAGKAGETLTAKGEFVVVRVNVTNIGDQTRTPNCSCQILFNDKGQKFEPSSSILSTKEALKFVRRIDPGDTVNGLIMLFDVAPGTKAVNIELHDSPLTQGVRVRLYSAREATST